MSIPTPTPLVDTAGSIIFSLFLTIVGVVIGEIMIYEILRKREKPKIIIDVAQRDNRLGFSVSTQRKSIKNAQVRLNKTSYDWEDENGRKISEKTLYPGDRPLCFYPYQVNAKFVKDISKIANITISGREGSRGGIVITVSDVLTGNLLYLYPARFPKDAPSFSVYNLVDERIDVSLRLIGDGIEEKKDYFVGVRLKHLKIPKIIKDEPVMDTITYDFSLNKKHFGLW